MDDEAVNDKHNEGNNKSKQQAQWTPGIQNNNNNNVNQPSAYKSSECNGIGIVNEDEDTISFNDCPYNEVMINRTDPNHTLIKTEKADKKDDVESNRHLNGLCKAIKMKHNRHDEKCAQSDDVKLKEIEAKKSDESDDGNDSNGDDADSNSTDNLSFLSEEDFIENTNNGIINEIILLPNNLLSEDELSNSDDCVYAYRGADFDPIRANTEDENDFLEMDFEPDPTSEVEQDNNNILNCSIGSQRTAPPLFEPSIDILERSPNASRDSVDAIDPNQQRKIIENAKINCSQIKEWKKQTETLLNIIWKDDGDDSEENEQSDKISIDGAIPSTTDASDMERKDWLMKTSNKEIVDESQPLFCAASSSSAPQSSESYYDKTVSLASKKYTGTIPKSNRSSATTSRSNRTSKSSSSTILMKMPHECSTNTCSDCNKGDHKADELWTEKNHDNCKRWKIDDEESICSADASATYHDQSIFNSSSPSVVFRGIASSASASTSSFSVGYGPSEVKSSSYEKSDCPINFNRNAQIFSTHIHKPSSGCDKNFIEDNNHNIDVCDYQRLNLSDDAKYNAGEGYDASLVHDTVTIYSIDCTIDIVIRALAKINVQPDLEILRREMPCVHHSLTNPISRPEMNIPEYLVYMSKLNCNFKAIISAIRLACTHHELNTKFFPTESILLKPEVVCVPICEILNKLPTNGSLKNILSIKNKQFHKANVLGKIVNVIRKFSDMRYDIIKENYITIPQYYRSGYICISKKEANSET